MIDFLSCTFICDINKVIVINDELYL